MRRCRSEGELRAYLDSQLPSETMRAVQGHLDTCPACRARLGRLEADRLLVGEKLALAGPESTPSTARALASLNHRLAEGRGSKKRMDSMSKSLNHRWRPVLAALALVALVVVAFTFEPVQVAARDFLSIFRVRDFAVVPVGPEEREQIREAAELLEQNFFLSEPTVLVEPEERTVSTPEEASAVVGFAVRTPSYLPDWLGPLDGLQVSTQGVGLFDVDLEMARSLFEMLELDPALLPDSLGEEPLEFVLPPMAAQTWTHEGRTAMTFIQVPSPTIDYPEDVDPQALGTAALQLLGMDQIEAERLSQSIDWTNTLVLPIPTDISSFREVAIDGTRGLLISERYDEHGSHTALMWQRDGIVYFLGGDLSDDLIMDVADSIE
jgi:hypothetical protein